MKTPLECLAEELGTQPEKSMNNKSITQIEDIRRLTMKSGVYAEISEVESLNDHHRNVLAVTEMELASMRFKSDGREVWSHDLYDDGMSEVGLLSCSDHIQGKWVKFEDVEYLHKADRANADLVVQCNRMDSMLHERDAIIQKLKRDVETLTGRRNDLIGQKSEIMSALWNLVQARPNDPHCQDFKHEDFHEPFVPCPKQEKFESALEKAHEIIMKFIRKPKN